MVGLWACDINDSNDWITWCRENKFLTDIKYNDQRWFKFKLIDSKILLINNASIIYTLPRMKCTIEGLDHLYESYVFLDYEKLSKKYDAIKFDIANDYIINEIIFGIDCNCILVLNGDKVIEVESSDKSEV